jgi:hypothetical protein
VPSRLPHGRHRRPVPGRCAPLHFLPHDRARGADSAGASRPHRGTDLRMRRLPGGLPLESLRRPERVSAFLPKEPLASMDLAGFSG